MLHTYGHLNYYHKRRFGLSQKDLRHHSMYECSQFPVSIVENLFSINSYVTYLFSSTSIFQPHCNRVIPPLKQYTFMCIRPTFLFILLSIMVLTFYGVGFTYKVKNLFYLKFIYGTQKAYKSKLFIIQKLKV